MIVTLTPIETECVLAALRTADRVRGHEDTNPYGELIRKIEAAAMVPEPKQAGPVITGSGF